MKQIGYPNSKTSYTELVGNTGPGASPFESFRMDYQRIVRKMLIPWDGRQQALIDILGQTITAGSGGGNFIYRYTPAPYGDYTWAGGLGSPNGGGPYLWATGVDYEGYGVPTNGNMVGGNLSVPTNGEVARYRYARATVTYESLPFDILDNPTMTALKLVDSNGNPDEATLARYVTKQFRPAARYLTVPKGTMQIVGSGPNAGSDPIAVGLSPGKIVVDCDVRITHWWLPTVAVQSFFVNPNLSAGSPGAINTTFGKVNATDFPPTTDPDDPDGGTFPAGSLLYVGCVLVPLRAPTGGRIWNLEHMFNFASNTGGQNYVPYATGSTAFGWVELAVDNNHYSPNSIGKHIYDGAEFATLFRAP